MKSLINIRIILRAFGISILIVGLFMLTAIPFGIYYNEVKATYSILFSAFSALVTGGLLTFLTRKSSADEIREREAIIIVTLTWFMIGFFGSLPFIISGSIPDFTSAYFEAISGFTTTGASILTDIEVLPKSILYWRAITQWLGGMGILVLVIAILPSIGYGGVKLFVAEAPGPSSNKIHPKIRQTAIKLWAVYTYLTLLLIILLCLGEMTFYESVCHAFTTLSTGGFSPKNSSIAEYSTYSQIVITVFMFFGGLNFALHYYLIRGRIKHVITNNELIAFFSIIVVFSLIISAFLFNFGSYTSFSEGLKHSFFQSVSIITTTGYVTADYMVWPEATWFLLLLFFFTGGMIGSTAGGIKFTRHFVLLKNLRGEIKRFIHPNAIIPIRINKKIIPDEIIRNFFIVFIAYILFFCMGSLALSFYIDSFLEASSVSISCLGAIGPAFGEFGPTGNYASLQNGGKWIASTLMIIGRLEVLPFIMFLHFAFWRK
jgi:trk system potassium uptake protein